MHAGDEEREEWKKVVDRSGRVVLLDLSSSPIGMVHPQLFIVLNNETFPSHDGTYLSARFYKLTFTNSHGRRSGHHISSFGHNFSLHPAPTRILTARRIPSPHPSLVGRNVLSANKSPSSSMMDNTKLPTVLCFFLAPATIGSETPLSPTSWR